VKRYAHADSVGRKEKPDAADLGAKRYAPAISPARSTQKNHKPQRPVYVIFVKKC